MKKLIYYISGTSEAEETHVFSSPGENVALPCINVLSDCTSSTWIYNKHTSSAAVELIYGGIKKKRIERAERLSLGSDCSLNIYKTTEEDCGQYTCRQYVNGQKHGTDAQVYLHVLHVSPSSTQTEMRSGSSVTLTCQLFSYEDSCDSLLRFEELQLFWVNQADVNLKTDSRYQILSPGPCIITLTTILLNEDNTEWRCLVKKKNEIKTSASYTVRFTGLTKTDAVTEDTTINTERRSTLNSPVTPIQHSQVPVIAAVIAAIFLFAVVLLGVICIKRSGRHVVTDKLGTSFTGPIYFEKLLKRQ
ncbi:uncharacterized protein [Paramisgurnus dabryanus]|uniref:uncharacterized protein n=1 Tax=Paramisgurnus dabryanus TaxID=90735 RepID=UPI003CCF1206